MFKTEHGTDIEEKHALDCTNYRSKEGISIIIGSLPYFSAPLLAVRTLDVSIGNNYCFNNTLAWQKTTD